MKKLILTFVLLFTVSLSTYAADNIRLAEVIGVEYDGIILEIENNDLKVNDKVVIKPAGSMQGKVTEVENSLITLAVDNNGFAAGSKVLLKNADKFGRLGAKKAEVKTVNVNSIVLDVLDNSFKVNDILDIDIDGDKQAVVKSVNKNIVIISIKNTGFAEGSKIFIKKGRERFSEKAKK